MTARVAVLLVGVALAVAGCAAADPDPTAAPPAATTSPSAADPAATDPPSTAPAAPTGPQVVATGLEAPWSIARSDDLVLVSERDSGRILRLAEDGRAHEVGVVEGVVADGEGGLLGLAFDDEGRLYAYSKAAGGNRIQRIELTGDPAAPSLGAAETILDGLPTSNIHNGGRIHFGPDGMLYASVGDAGDPASAQDPSVLGGKILRMTPDGDPAPGNPDPATLVYSMGHRNVQGFGWAPDGTMFATEFGQDTWDELNRIEAGGNYGWPEVEGAGGEAGGFLDPVQQWTTPEASPSGLAIVDDVILIANLRGSLLRAVAVADPGNAVELHRGEFGRLRDVIAAPDGGIWILTNNTDGRGDPGPDDDRIIRIDLPAVG
ncbi:PQQ-dependent sugar dehydrogenase [Microbacterium sp. JZ31]|uniref:PQQ-dependent sugar dehydrogenase n=1 Tax=Microbacterium sp. JZ31 TaxID=1906274 RepID=UPI001933E3DC|nr:PQQ-dependent sugar dehydrogenase [Microbacterium sp. JZ31]